MKKNFTIVLVVISLLSGMCLLWGTVVMWMGMAKLSTNNSLILFIEALVSLLTSWTAVLLSAVPATTLSPEAETTEQILARLERRARQDAARRITGGILVVFAMFCIGCMEAADTKPFDTTLAGQISQILSTKHLSIAALANQLAVSSLDDAAQRSLWNDSYKTIVDKASTDQESLLKSALLSQETHKAIWLQVAKAYSK